MKHIRRIVGLVAALLLCISAACAERLNGTQAGEIVKEIICNYGYHPDTSASQIAAQLEDLKSLDRETGEKWEEVMRCWEFTRSGLAVHTDAVPEGLDEGDRLCFVVLGFQLNKDGSMKDELIGRLKIARACAERYPNAYVLCTGGGTAANAPEATEAGKMAEWLKANGVDARRIIIEDRSKTTGQNAMFSHEILQSEYPQVEQIVLVSSDYHIPWGTILFEAEFIVSEGYERTIFVASNAAYRTNRSYPLTYQAAGLLEIAGFSEEAMIIYG